LGKNSLVKKRKCEILRCRDATASSFVTKVQSEVFARFHAVAVKNITVSCESDCLACQNEFFVMSKEMMSMLFILLYTCLSFFGLGEFVCASRVWLMFSSPNACLIIAWVSVALSPRFTQNFMLFLFRAHLEIASGQTNDSI
jgi:hypothetical protein